MNDTETQSTMNIVLQELPLNWKWMLTLGISMIFLGTIGLLASGFLTLTSVLIFGGFIFAGGLLQMVHAIQVKEEGWSGKLQHILIAALYIIAGVIVFWDPLVTSLFLTILLASLFAVIGIARLWYASYCKKQDWKWFLPALSGVFDLIIAVIIIVSLPGSAIWLIGMLIAIEMLFNGWFFLFLGLRVRKIESNK